MKTKRHIVFLILLGLLAIVAAVWFLKSPAKQNSKTAAPVTHVGDPRLYPDPALTAGAIDPAVSQDDIQSTICVPGYAKSVRPPSSVMRVAKQRALQAYGLTGSPRDYELDHFIPLELGGCPDCQSNLWPEPYAPAPGAHEKDVVENYLHREVCAGNMSLQEAQRRIVSDWYRVYLEMRL